MDVNRLYLDCEVGDWVGRGLWDVERKSWFSCKDDGLFF